MRVTKLLVAALVLGGSALAEPHLFSIKVAITNPTDQDRPAEDIVSPITRPLLDAGGKGTIVCRRGACATAAAPARRMAC